jgi:hypothetical protein
MGARNVSAVFALWPTLPPLPKVLLLGMALQSLDAPSADGRPARVFFGGQDALVEFGGRSRTAAYRALKTLREHGAVEVLDAGRNGHRAVYRLALDPLAEGSQNRDASTLDDEEAESRNRDAKGSRNRDGRVPESGPLGRTKNNKEITRRKNLPFLHHLTCASSADRTRTTTTPTKPW